MKLDGWNPGESVLGFTGTQDGMTFPQKNTVAILLGLLQPVSVIHGDCVGADEDFHELTRRVLPHAEIRTRPSNIVELRAGCNADSIYPPQPPLKRDEMLVMDSDLLLATPKKRVEETRSGTWFTVRTARKMGRGVIIVWLDGTITLEGWDCGA